MRTLLSPRDISAEMGTRFRRITLYRDQNEARFTIYSTRDPASAQFPEKLEPRKPGNVFAPDVLLRRKLRLFCRRGIIQGWRKRVSPQQVKPPRESRSLIPESVERMRALAMRNLPAIFSRSRISAVRGGSLSNRARARARGGRRAEGSAFAQRPSRVCLRSFFSCGSPSPPSFTFSYSSEPAGHRCTSERSRLYRHRARLPSRRFQSPPARRQVRCASAFTRLCRCYQPRGRVPSAR